MKPTGLKPHEDRTQDPSAVWANLRIPGWLSRDDDGPCTTPLRWGVGLIVNIYFETGNAAN